MTQQHKIATLATTFSEVLADLAFMFSEDDQSDVDPAGAWLETKIGYSGSECGNLRFRCPAEFCTHLAANLLGVDPSDDTAESQSRDAVKEFMNVVCGHFVTSMYGTEEVFDLTIPETASLSDPPDLSINDGERIATITVEGFPVQLEYEPGTQPETNG